MTVNLDGVAWVVYTNTSTGEITRCSSAPGDPNDLPSNGAVVGSETLYHLTIREEQTYNFGSPATFMRRYHRSGNSWVDRDLPPTEYYNWNFSSSAWEVSSTILLREVRGWRNQKLGESDWTQLSDNQLTDSKKAEWATYRQSLRDIMTNLPADLDHPNKVVWPTEPS